MNVRVYTFSYENDVRAENMKRRFLHEDTPLEFVPAVQPADSRLAAAPENVKRVWAIMFNHLDMLSAFLIGLPDFVSPGPRS